MIIRPIIAADTPKIPPLLDAAFGEHSEALLVQDLRDGGDLVFEFTATINYETVGYLALSRLISPKNCLALAPLAVHPDRHGKGIGTALIRAGVEAAEEAGWVAIFVLGDPDYYDRSGFSVAAAGAFDTPYAPEFTAAHVLDPSSFDSLEREIIYPPAFALVG